MKNLLNSNNDISNLHIESTLMLKEYKVELSFVIEGALKEYVFSNTVGKKRADELWKATCFELFLANSKKEEYYELNFSSSLAWNFYYLKTYRADVTEVTNVSTPQIELHKTNNSFKITIELELENLEEFDICNVACIVLRKNEERTFWSKKHQNSVADFHDRKNFFKIS